MPFVEQRKSEMKFLDWGELGKYKNGEKHDEDEYVILPEGNFYLEGTLSNIAESAEHLGYIIRDAVIYEGSPTDAKHGKVVKKVKYPLYIGHKASLTRQMLEGEEDDFIPVKEGDKLRIQYTGTYKTKQGGTGIGTKVLVEREK